jgi:hypothetical protein
MIAERYRQLCYAGDVFGEIKLQRLAWLQNFLRRSGIGGRVFQRFGSHHRPLEPRGVNRKFDNRRRYFWFAQHSRRPSGKICPASVFGGGRGNRAGRHLPERSRIAIQRHRRPLPLRADGAGQVLGNSNRVDDVVVTTRGGLRHRQSFCHLSCGVHPTRSAADLSCNDSGRADR